MSSESKKKKKRSNLILGTWENTLNRKTYNKILVDFVQMLSRLIYGENLKLQPKFRDTHF